MIKLNRPECPHPIALKNKNYKHPKNKDALKKYAHDKCMYCESKISHIDYAHVEHIKPKAVGKFPELEFVWENLGYACPKCNINKDDKYDLGTPFINPYEEDPENHFIACGPLIFSNNGSERGELTLQIVELNRKELIERRHERIVDIQKLNDSIHKTINPKLKKLALGELMKEREKDKEYSLCVKYCLKCFGYD